MQRLQNKIAFVTGGSRGIGAGIVKRLAAEGAIVTFTYARSAAAAQQVVQEVAAQGGKAIAVQTDSEATTSLTEAIQQTAHTYGHIDILVNNAGIGSFKGWQDYTVQDFDQTIAVNVRAVFIATIEAAKHMPAGSRVITIGSNMGERVTDPGGTLYAMSKSALLGANKGFARDLGAKGITVNLVQPGPVDTDMNPDNTDHARLAKSRMPLNTYGTPAQIAGLVAYLASEESAFMTGSSIVMDGGYNA